MTHGRGSGKQYVEYEEIYDHEGSGFVYFIVAGDTEWRGAAVKIGVSGDPEKRIRDLQTSHHLDLRLVAKIPSAHAEKLELELHNQFRDSHIRGEWFWVTDEIRDFIFRMQRATFSLEAA